MKPDGAQELNDTLRDALHTTALPQRTGFVKKLWHIAASLASPFRHRSRSLNDHLDTLKSVLLPALAGDQTRRQQYVTQRTLELDTLPASAVGDLYAVARRCYERFPRKQLVRYALDLCFEGRKSTGNIPRYLRTSGTTEMMRNEGRLAFAPYLFHQLGISHLTSIAAAEEFLRAVETAEKNFVLQRPLQPLSGDDLFQFLTFSPFGGSRLAAYAMAATRELVPLLIKHRVVADLMLVEGVELSAASQRRLVQRLRDPWAVLECRVVRGLLECDAYLREKLGAAGSPARQRLLNAFLFAPQPLEKLRDFLEAMDDRSTLVIADSAPASRAAEQAGFSKAAIVVMELHDSIAERYHRLGEEEVRKLTVHLSRLGRSAHLAPGKIIRQIREGKDPEVLVSELQQALKTTARKDHTAATAAETPLVAPPAAVLQPAPELKLRLYCEGDGSPVMQQWLNRAEQSVRDDVEAYLEKLRQGNMGDHRRLTGGRLLEGRIPRHGGLRVYFTKLRDGGFLVLHAGVKATQAGDVELARERLAAFRRRREQ